MQNSLACVLLKYLLSVYTGTPVVGEMLLGIVDLKPSKHITIYLGPNPHAAS